MQCFWECNILTALQQPKTSIANQESFKISGSDFPYLGTTLFPKNGLPFSLGLRLSYFKADFNYFKAATEGKDPFNLPYFDDLNLKTSTNWWVFQLPIGYSYYFHKNELSFSFSPAVYLNHHLK